MELNKESLQAKANALRVEIVQLVQKANSDVAAAQNGLQDMVRNYQKTVDNKEGQLAQLLELIGPEEKKDGNPVGSGPVGKPDIHVLPPPDKTGVLPTPDAPTK